MSFLALRDLMLAVGYSAETAWVFPAIIDTAVAVSTVMLVALGDKPSRAVTPPVGAISPTARGIDDANVRSTKDQIRHHASTSASVHGVHDASSSTATADADLAAELIASRATTQPIETVLEVLAARRTGASINAAARESGINYRTAQRIVEAAFGARPAVLERAG